MLKRLIKSVVRRFGYEIIAPRWVWGIDFLADLTRVFPREDIRIVFDVGANVGQTALRLSHCFPAATVYAFEPVDGTFDCLATNVASHPQIRPFNVALGAECTRKDMIVYDDQSCVSSFLADAPYATAFLDGANSTPLSVNVATVDDICRSEHIGIIDLLKIDTEGYDCEVLKGATAMLARNAVRFVYCEFYSLGDPEQPRNGDLFPIARLLGRYGLCVAGLYVDYIIPQRNFFAVRNALFALPTGLAPHGADRALT